MLKAVGLNLSPRRRGVEPVVVFSLSGAVAFFVISGIIAYFNLQTLRENTARITHTHEVITRLIEVLSDVQDAETGQRGFIITGNERYLEPYQGSLGLIARRIDDIAQLTVDDPVQHSLIARLRLHVAAKIAELKESIEVRRTRGFEAALAIVNSDRGKIEMDGIRARLSAMRDQENEQRTKHLAETKDAYQTALFSGILAALLGIALTITIGFLIRRATLLRQREEWLQTGQAGLASAMLGDRSIRQLGDSILDFLTGYLGAVAGAIYVAREGDFVLASSYGVPPDARLPNQFKLREGLMGQVAADNTAAILRDVPDDYLSFGSALGQSKPRHLLLAPGSVDGNVNTVLELGFLRPLDESAHALLREAAPAIAVAVRTARFRGELQSLLEETQRQAEELQAQSEELRVSNEELSEQSRVLQDSQTRLEQQQVELEQTNSQLEEQAQQLEAQRDSVARAHASVELKARELEQASRYKSDFLANMSHELRTPLNSLLILAKLLADNPDDNLSKEQVSHARTIQSSGNDLLNLINDILDLSKIEAGHIDIRPQIIQLTRLANSLRRVFQPIADNKKVALVAEIAPDCPQQIETDTQRLEQVLKNLLSNAFKFTEAGQVTLAIKPDGPSRVKFMVIDTGIGIPEEQQQAVFEAFHQADGSISRRYGGTGLGLSISRELARLLGGSISLESTAGHGSTFTVTIPVAYDPAKIVSRNLPAAAAGPKAETAPPAIDKPQEAMRPRLSQVADDREALSDVAARVLLVVEDDETFARILRDMSREMGFRALVAGTAEEALKLAKEFKPNAIVLDVGLPDQSGLSVLDRLKRDVQTRHIPIHVISASDQADTALSLGAIGYMMKPVKREQIVEVLQKLEAKLSQGMHRVLIVEDDPVQRAAVAKLLSAQDVETVTAGTAAECLTLLQSQTFDCMVLDLSLPDTSGFSLLETLSNEGAYAFPPVIVYTGRDLSFEDEQRLRRYSKSIIIKGAKSPERLLDEVALFMHQVVSDLPPERQKMIRDARNRDALLEGRRILIVEDDVRNVYALTNILEPRGASIEIARNGQEALDALARFEATAAQRIDLVLMDVMMPVMDGLTATRKIRQNPDWKKLPIITLTAKAMPDDQQRCIDAGANDYVAKPLDVEKLLSLVRVWMPR